MTIEKLPKIELQNRGSPNMELAKYGTPQYTILDLCGVIFVWAPSKYLRDKK